MHDSITVVLFLVGIVSLSTACNVEVRLSTDSKEPILAQIFVPSVHRKTEPILLKENVERSLQIVGKQCMKSKWVLRTWKMSHNGKWRPMKQEQAKVDGSGWIKVHVQNDLTARLIDSEGVQCVGGQLCGKKPIKKL